MLSIKYMNCKQQSKIKHLNNKLSKAYKEKDSSRGNSPKK